MSVTVTNPAQILDGVPHQLAEQISVNWLMSVTWHMNTMHMRVNTEGLSHHNSQITSHKSTNQVTNGAKSRLYHSVSHIIDRRHMLKTEWS